MHQLNIVFLGSILISSSYELSLPSRQVADPGLALETPGVFESTFSNLTTGEGHCNVAYGLDLKVSSCTNAWNKMPRDNERSTYGLRTADTTGAAGAHVDTKLPVRYLSDDGHCTIDIRGRRNSDKDLRAGDSATNVEVSEAAKSVIRLCVLPELMGGYSVDFSSRYVPSSNSFETISIVHLPETSGGDLSLFCSLHHTIQPISSAFLLQIHLVRFLPFLVPTFLQ